MALTQRLEFRQSQSLVMTPQLMQAIKLLQLSNLDLAAFVEEELEAQSAFVALWQIGNHTPHPDILTFQRRIQSARQKSRGAQTGAAKRQHGQGQTDERAAQPKRYIFRSYQTI